MVDQSETGQGFMDTEAFFEEYAKLTASGDMFILHFTGTVREDGSSWCPDCVEAKPVINSVKAETKLNFVRASVTREEWLGNKEHPYKKHPVLAVAGAPSLLLCQKD